MPESRFSQDQLIAFALGALEEAVKQCRSKPLKPSATLRFTLAFLGNQMADKTPFTEFWQAATSSPKDMNPLMVNQMRSSAADGALYRIYVALGLQRPRG